MVTFYAFVRDALLRMAGATPAAAAAAARGQRSADPQEARPHRVPARHRQPMRPMARWQVAITGSQGSGILRSMSQANGMVLLHHAQGNVAAGELVDVLPFDAWV